MTAGNVFLCSFEDADLRGNAACPTCWATVTAWSHHVSENVCRMPFYGSLSAWELILVAVTVVFGSDLKMHMLNSSLFCFLFCLLHRPPSLYKWKVRADHWNMILTNISGDTDFLFMLITRLCVHGDIYVCFFKSFSCLLCVFCHCKSVCKCCGRVSDLWYIT